MKSRMFVVNSDTLLSTITNNVASIKVPDLSNSEYWLKTVSDIMADMLQIEIGDYIFLWEVRSENQKSRIHGVFRAISKPYYDASIMSDEGPFKIKIEKAYDFKNPIDEYDLLNCPYIKTNLWTLIGKKVAGKPRGTSPLSLEESKHLITLLIGANSDYSYIPWDKKRIELIENPLKVDYNLRGNNDRPTSLSELNPSSLNFFNNRNEIYYEKILETIFNQELTARNSSFLIQLGIDANKIIWYSNYLPYSIEQSEMDYVIVESEDGYNISKIYVLEFMKTSIDKKHIYRCLMYSKWVNETLALGTNLVQPIIICNNSVDFIQGETAPTKISKMNELNEFIINNQDVFNVKDLEIYKYDFSAETPMFIRKR